MSTWMGLAPRSGDKGWTEVVPPRIRHITSIRVHNLTIQPSSSTYHTGPHSSPTVPSHNPEHHLSVSPSAISTHPRARRSSQPTTSGLSHVSQAFETHLDRTIEEEGSGGRSSSLGSGEPSSPRVGNRPGLATTRSRSRLIVPRHGSVSSPGAGIGSTNSYGFPSVSPTSPTLPTSTLPESSHPNRRRSASISSVRSNISAMYPSHDLAYRRERAATLNSMIPTREEQVILRMKVKERLRRCFVTLSLASESRPEHRGEVDRGDGRSILANGESSGPRSVSGSSSASLARTRPSMSRPSSLSNSLVRSSSTQSTMTTSTSTTTSRSTSPTTPGSSPSRKGSTTPTRDGVARRVSLGKAELSHARKALSGVPVPAVGTGKHGRGGSTRPSPGRMLGTTVPPPKTSMEVGGSAKKITVPSIPTPFYISPLHRPSIYPTFTSLDKRSDFADWLNVEDEAGHLVRLDVWVEKEGGRVEGNDSPGWDRVTREVLVDLRKLKEVHESDKPFPDNTLLFTFSNRGPTQFFLPPMPALGDPGGGSDVAQPPPPQSQAQDGKHATMSAAVQRSLKETRMVRGITLATLHHLVNLEAVLRDTQRSRMQISSTLDAAILQDKTHNRLTRELNEQAIKNRRLEIAIGNVMSRCQATRANIAERRSNLQGRRAALSQAHRGSECLRHRVQELEDGVSEERSHRNAIQPATIRLRARSAQILDYMFPILPLDPQTLLYTIMSVPLPIPQTPTAAAPPVSMPSGLLPLGAKVDEDSSATALGFVAIVVQVLAGLLEHQLVYPVTCVGSRSLVRDPISVINGPRSFPLYAKGVERYRYEYAVFLLNKNIEFMMVDARIRIEDMRHTLPNLKTLLLTVSAEVSSHDLFVKKRNPSLRLSSPYTFPSRAPSTAVIGSPSSGNRTIVNTPGSTISQAAAKLHYIMGD